MVSTSRGGSRVVHAELACKMERRKAAERRAKAAAAPSTVSTFKRPGGGGRGGVMPEGLKSGSDHHRLEICGPSNGRHKIA